VVNLDSADQYEGGLMLIDAPEASRRLRIKPATLYAYVSRGLVRSAAKPGSKAHLYYAADVERLKRDLRKGRRTGAPIASYDRYAPILDTSLCLIHEGRLFYRGLDAVGLATTASLEDIAKLLWQAPGDFSFAPTAAPAGFPTWLADLPQDGTALERAIAIMVRMAAEDYGVHQEMTGAVMLRAGQRVLLAIAGAVTGKAMRPGLMHEQLGRIWRVKAAGADIVRRSLVLSADHELNPSTYVARCVASTGATLYSAIIAALCSFSGPRHGGHILRVEAMLAELLAAGRVKTQIKERWRRGDRLIGFGHPLYPDGDPRGRALLEALRERLPRAKTAPIFEIAEMEFEQSGRAPLLDYALAAASRLLDLPLGSAQAIFLVGRSAGWIAQALEQYASGAIIRPCARYVGPLPQS
jgi:citrate synthase